MWHTGVHQLPNNDKAVVYQESFLVPQHIGKNATVLVAKIPLVAMEHLIAIEANIKFLVGHDDVVCAFSIVFYFPHNTCMKWNGNYTSAQ